MNNNSLFLPHGYGIGTIIYDLKGNPYEATKCLMEHIYEIVPVSKEYAETKSIEKKLMSVPEN